MPTKIEKDEVTGRETTGHEWDGVRELNTPLPRWWVNLFWVTIVWAAACSARARRPRHVPWSRDP